MTELIDWFGKLTILNRRAPKYDDAFIDRLHSRYTVTLLLLSCVAISTVQYAGDPITCWVPAQFTRNYEMFTNKLCWIKSTYYVPQSEPVPNTKQERSRRILKYYQWINFILVLQSFLFYFPKVIWRAFNNKCGLNVSNYSDATMRYEMIEGFQQQKQIEKFLTEQMIRYIKSRERKTARKDSAVIAPLKKIMHNCCFWMDKRHGNYFVVLYTTIRLLYLMNSIGQIFLFSALLGLDLRIYDIEMMTYLLLGGGAEELTYFPKVTLCDFTVRELGVNHQYTVECVLSINIFLEKIYIFLWFWFVLLSIFSIYDLLIHFYRISTYSQRKFINSLLAQKVKYMPKTKHFVLWLGTDIVFVLRLLSSNSNSFVIHEVTWLLYEFYNNEMTNLAEEDECKFINEGQK